MPGWTVWVWSATTASSSGVAGGEVIEDRGQVAIGEAAGPRGQPEGFVDAVAADQRGQLDGPDHLRAHALRPDRGGLDQPAFSAGTDGQEVGFGVAAGPFGRPWARCRQHDAGSGEGRYADCRGSTARDGRSRRSPCSVWSATITISSPTTRHHTSAPWWPSGVE